MAKDSERRKKAAAKKSTEYIKEGMVVGLGTGSTIYWMLKELGTKIEKGLNVTGVASSKLTEEWAEQFGIPLISIAEVDSLDLAIDGADEVDPHFNLIKGGGGALLREKMNIDIAKKTIIIIGESKLVTELGAFHIPVEIVPYGHTHTFRRLAQLDCTPRMRMKEGELFLTDNGNHIVDCEFSDYSNLGMLESKLLSTVGVIETGLFLGCADKIIVGGSQGVREIDAIF